MTSYHVMNFGKFGGNIPRDLQSYTHTTPQEWAKSPNDWGPTGRSVELCKELAERSREEIAKAEKALAQWQAENCGV